MRRTRKQNSRTRSKELDFIVLRRRRRRHRQTCALLVGCNDISFVQQRTVSACVHLVVRVCVDALAGFSFSHTSY